MLVTVVVCTMRSREPDLLACLESLGRAESPFPAEVLVVHREGEPPAQVPARLANGLPVRQAGSRTRGVAEKRNVGVRAARGKVIAFVDDDATVERDYLLETRRAFEGGVDAVAGLVEPEFGAPVPPEILPVVYRVGGFNCFEGRLQPDHWVSANCAFRRDFLLSLGPFDTRLGPGSPYLPWGEDAEMFLRARARGDVRFAPAVRVRHRIQAERLTRDYVMRRIHSTGRTLCVLDRLHRPDFFRRSTLVPLFWVRAGLASSARPGELELRLRFVRYGGYLRQLALLLALGMPAP